MLENNTFWETKEYVKQFNFGYDHPSFRLKQLYRQYNEFKLIESYLPKKQNKSLIDIGCSSGNLFRYFNRYYPNITYQGCDISNKAIEFAKKKFGDHFFVVDNKLNNVKRQYDFVFCRDVIPHIITPYSYLKKLCELSNDGLFLRLRTKDHGSEIFDVNRSCTCVNDYWMPYIILNFNRLIEFFRNLDRKNRVVVYKSYKVLGGYDGTFLPKDCYISDTGTCVTSVFVDFNSVDENIVLEKTEIGVNIFDKVLFMINYRLK